MSEKSRDAQKWILVVLAILALALLVSELVYDQPVKIDCEEMEAENGICMEL